MKITNMLHFTENHPFCMYRDFSLSGMDYRMLSGVYQPMVGAFAVGVYTTLYQSLSDGKVGFSSWEQQRAIFMALELEPGERGRKYFIEQTSKLEAVGLLQTKRRYLADMDDYSYEYQLFQPLGPVEFFKNQHLILLLRDKIGKHMVLHLKDQLIAVVPEGLETGAEENLSVPFYELFRLNTQVIDYELEQALSQSAPSREVRAQMDVTTKGFSYADIIMRFPRESRNREFVEALKQRQDQLIELNMAARKYELTLQETCRLLDEDGMFDEEGNLCLNHLQEQANLFYRQGKKRGDQAERRMQKVVALRASDEESSSEEYASEKPVEMAYYVDVPPIFVGQCDVHQYNMLLRNEPYTIILKRFFSQGSVPDGVLDIFEKIDLNYKLPEEVINVMIHYIHTHRRSWAKSSIEYVATDMLGKHISTYEQAVDYIREVAKYKEKAASAKGTGTRSGGSRARGKQKPVIPSIGDMPPDVVTPEELEEMRKLAQKLDGKGSGNGARSGS